MTMPNVWLQALVTVGVALALSSVSLLYRYRQKGHPFGSRAAAMWAVSVIVVTAAPAGVALLLPKVPPAYLGVAVPAVLMVRGDRLHNPSKPTEDAFWYRVVTLAVPLLLDRLVQQMDTDRDNWVKRYMDALPDMEVMERFTEDLYSTLETRTSMCPQLKALQAHRDKVSEAAGQLPAGYRFRPFDPATEYPGCRDNRKAAHEAKKALTGMLHLAYNFGHQSAADIALPPPPALPVAPAGGAQRV